MKWICQEGENLVSFLQTHVTGSGKFLRKVLEANFCKVNGKVERFGSTQLQKGDRVELSPGWQEKQKPLLFTTLYEDENCLIVNKPAGWVCDVAHCHRQFPRYFLVHRLDKETSGALLLAKKKKQELMDLFAERKVEKRYFAVVDGLPREEEGVRETRLAPKRSYQGQTIWGSSPRGQLATTRWRVLARGKNASLLLCEPLTGRTHQIRVHLAEMGHPILIDRQYAERFRSSFFVRRPLLHARELRFVFAGREIRAEAPLPEDFELARNTLFFQADALP